MPYLIESYEWRLLQGLASLLGQRKSQYSEQVRPLSDQRAVHPNAELFEFELRRTFMVKECSQNLDLSQFEKCQEKLKNLCSLLDHLALPSGASSGLENQNYPGLRGLAGFLESKSGAIDFVNGPNETVFRLPRASDELRTCLSIVTECNDALSRLLDPPPQDSIRRPLQKQMKKGAWKKARIRKRASFVLETLFKHFKCGESHEVMLRLTEDPDEKSTLPTLKLMLSTCAQLEWWQEVLCDSTYLGESSISSIPNICAHLQQSIGQGKALMLLIEKYGLFGAWTGHTACGTCSPSKESLDQLISKGAFKPLDINALFHGDSPDSFSISDKRALAVKLGFCLMDFFDVDLTSNRIYFLDASKLGPDKEPPYLAFGSKLPATNSSYNFRIGHPALLSFAKLLLEMDFGQSIDAHISSDSRQNRETWAKLLGVVEQLKEQRSDSYLQAIEGCLNVHRKIAMALRSRKLEVKDMDSKIRKELYKEVVCKLELGLNESIPRSPHKRKRSESPPPSHRWSGSQGSSSSKTPRQSLEPERIAPQPNKRRTSKAQQDSSLTMSTLGLGESSGLFDDYTPAKYPAHVCQFADQYLATHRLMYNNAIREYDACNIPVKVAILDSGLDIGHHIIQANRDRIKEVRTWMDGLEGKIEKKSQDYNGHGTHVTSLLLDIAPDCDVYIARVADSKPLAPGTIAKAINHAVHKWKIDIISLSFGYTDETEAGCDELRAAIAEAHAAGVLMFAAASNSGGHRSEPAFPARVSNVFCIYGGDGMGNSGPTNPTARKQSYNFLSLGEAVEGAWPRAASEYPYKLRKSGTSFATPIVAGIAAFLLLYARQNLQPEHADKFKQYDKMRNLLYYLSFERGGYNFISPREFFEKKPEERKNYMMRLLEGKSWK